MDGELYMSDVVRRLKALPPNTEFKTFRFELKSVDEEQGIIKGYLSTFGNVDSQDDCVIKGAFKKTIADAKARMAKGRKYLWPILWMHDPEQPLGGYIDAEEDDHGLLVTAQLDISTNTFGIPKNPQAVLVFSGFKTGYIDEQSMGYNAIAKEYVGRVRNLKECRIVEGSAVTMNFAANDQAITPASGVKTGSQEKEKSMQQTKDFNDHYREQRISDWIGSDFYNLIAALRQSSIDIFSIGDTPEPDAVNTVLNDGEANKVGFITAYKNWIQMGIDLDVSNYLNEQSQSDNVLYQLMTRSTPYMDAKAGRAISQENAAKLGAMMEQCKDMATKHAAMMEQHKAMMLQHKSMMEQANSVADDLSNVIGRQAYADNDDAGQQAGNDEQGGGSKSRRGPDTAPPSRDEQEPSFEGQLAAELAARVQRKKVA